MATRKSVEVAKRKKEVARTLFGQGKSPNEVRVALQEQFDGTSVANEVLYALHREGQGGKPRAKKRKKARRKKKVRKAVQKKRASCAVAKFEPVEIPDALLQSPARAVLPPHLRAAVGMLLELIRAEGFEGLTVHADGRCMIHKLATETVELS